MYKRYTSYLVGAFFLLVSCSKDIYVDSCHQEHYPTKIDSLKSTNKVLIIGIDGFRSDAMTEQISPKIHSLFTQNNTYNNLEHKTEEDTYSGPNWSSILTGVHLNKHNVIDNTFEGSNFIKYPSFFKYIEEHVPELNTASFVNWGPINKNVLSKEVDYAQDLENDSLVFQKSIELLENANPFDVDIFFIHFDELDAAGHNFGFSKNINEYTETITKLDYYVEKLHDIISNKRKTGENWLFIIVSDHGGDGTGHGDYDNIHIRNTIFLIEHPDTFFKNNHTSNMTDIAPTILSFIGIQSAEFSCKKDGISLIKQYSTTNNQQKR